MRLIAALGFVAVSGLSAAAQTAEELAADILYQLVDVPQLGGFTYTQLSTSPAIFETVANIVVLRSTIVARYTVSTADKCRFNSIIQSKVNDQPGTEMVLDYDFSSAVPPVTSIDTNRFRTVVQIPGLKVTGCTYKSPMPPGTPAEFRSDVEKMLRDAGKQVCDVFLEEVKASPSYSAERGTRALTQLKTNYCKAS